jgi:hypothetical protein
MRPMWVFLAVAAASVLAGAEADADCTVPTHKAVRQCATRRGGREPQSSRCRA